MYYFVVICNTPTHPDIFWLRIGQNNR